MRVFNRFGFLPLLGMAVVLGMTGCPQSETQVAASANQAGTVAQDSDPANANLAPVDQGTGAQAPAPVQQSSAPPQNYATGDSYQPNHQDVQDAGYAVQQTDYSNQAPPPLPQYQQPQDPGDGYIWTPGYWAWAPAGYYWVPGAWVEAPYEGALWTPGYWGYENDRYGFHRGYWGRHVGFYGGVDYGFGYIGFGYQGGYWGGGHFNYNTSVNNLNFTVERNVYNYNVSSRGENRVSFNGGAGGIQVRARPAELAALHEQHAAPMRAQLQNERAASTNRAQFANVNHGQPASVAASRPLAADRNVRVPAASPVRTTAVQQQQERQSAPQQQQRQAAPPQQQRQAAPPQQQRQAAPPQQQRQAAPLQQQRQAAPPPQQRQAAPPPQQRQAAPPQQQRQSAPQQQRQAAPQQQHQSAPPQQRQAAPQQEEHRK
jgi:hypothetical protein